MSFSHGISRRKRAQGATVAGLGLGGPGGWLRDRQAVAQTPAADSAASAIDAWIYGYPLVTVGATADVTTNMISPEGSSAPYNQFASLREFPDASLTVVVAPNVDTLYAPAFLDLSHGPIVFQWPDMGSGYFLFPFLNAWTDVTSCYWPEEAVLNGRWKLPTITNVE